VVLLGLSARRAGLHVRSLPTAFEDDEDENERRSGERELSALHSSQNKLVTFGSGRPQACQWARYSSLGRQT